MKKTINFMESVFHFGMALLFTIMFAEIIKDFESEIPFLVQLIPFLLSGIFANLWIISIYKLLKEGEK